MSTVRKIWENSNIKGRFPRSAASVRFDEPMRNHTTFKTGGPADLFVEPSTVEELCGLVEFFSGEGVSVSLLGGGSNLLVSDKGIRGAVLSLASFNSIARLDSQSLRAVVRCGAGASMESLVEWCASQELSGLSRFAGLPGSVGGAVFMNARCYDASISGVFFGAEILCFRSGRCTIEKAKYLPDEWDYKKSPFQSRSGVDPLVLSEGSRVVLSADFVLEKGDAKTIRAEMAWYVRDREEKGHFRFPSAGSMFKNNHAFGKPSGKLIDEAGLCSFRIGDAQVAPWHGNIVINVGNARSEDIRKLVEEVRRQVFEKTGFLLESEVILAGDW